MPCPCNRKGDRPVSIPKNGRLGWGSSREGLFLLAPRRAEDLARAAEQRLALIACTAMGEVPPASVACPTRCSQARGPWLGS